MLKIGYIPSKMKNNLVTEKISGNKLRRLFEIPTTNRKPRILDITYNISNNGELTKDTFTLYNRNNSAILMELYHGKNGQTIYKNRLNGITRIINK